MVFKGSFQWFLTVVCVVSGGFSVIVWFFQVFSGSSNSFSMVFGVFLGMKVVLGLLKFRKGIFEVLVFSRDFSTSPSGGSLVNAGLVTVVTKSFGTES